MSLDDKVGHLMMVGFPQSTLNSQLLKHLKKIHSSSFIFFKRNIKSLSQVAVLNRQLTEFTLKHMNTSPLLAVDQEGGHVARVATAPGVPSAFSVGLTNDSSLAFDLGLEVGKILKTYGFNMNLAPVLDLTDAKNKTFIGLRAFSSTSNVAAEMGTQYSRGLLEAGVLPTAKHFPGMTSILGDPHREVVSSPRSTEQFLAEDVVPYLKYISLGSQTAIMMSHLIYPGLDSSRTPAIYSRKISHDLLRTQMKYTGLVVTDDIQMRSHNSTTKTWTNAIDSLKAGADLLILSWSFRDQEKTFFEIKKAIEIGILPIQDIDEKVRRIVKVKRAFRQVGVLPVPMNGIKIHHSKKLEEVSNKILETNIGNVFSGTTDLKLNSRVCVYSTNPEFLNSFVTEKQIQAHIYRLNKEVTAKGLAKHIAKNNCALNLIPIHGRLNYHLIYKIKDPKLIQKTFVVNFSHPALLNSLWPEKQTIQLGYQYPGSGQVIAKSIANLMGSRHSARVDSRPELARAPAEQIPNSNRPKTR